MLNKQSISLNKLILCSLHFIPFQFILFDCKHFLVAEFHNSLYVPILVIFSVEHCSTIQLLFVCYLMLGYLAKYSSQLTFNSLVWFFFRFRHPLSFDLFVNESNVRYRISVFVSFLYMYKYSFFHWVWSATGINIDVSSNKILNFFNKTKYPEIFCKNQPDIHTKKMFCVFRLALYGWHIFNDIICP